MSSDSCTTSPQLLRILGWNPHKEAFIYLFIFNFKGKTNFKQRVETLKKNTFE
jgi:hypothetical protein